jgi:hypothetical protein
MELLSRVVEKKSAFEEGGKKIRDFPTQIWLFTSLYLYLGRRYRI